MGTQTILWIAAVLGLLAACIVIFDSIAVRAITSTLMAHGQTPARVRRRWFRRLFVRGFSLFGVAYWVTIQGDEGRRRLFGYEPAGWMVHSANGVKRFSGGVWRDELAPAPARKPAPTPSADDAGDDAKAVRHKRRVRRAG